MASSPSRSPGFDPVSGGEASELAAKLPTVLTHLSRRLRQTSGPLGVPPGHYPVLISLLDHSPATVSQLAAAEQVRVPSMTALLGQLEAERLIHKEVDSSDRRFVQVSLTSHGTAVAKAARQLRGAWFAQRLSHLSAREIAALERALPALEHLIGVER